ncbi:MAG: SRPBCC family protein [Acidimicrobiaceae bacterium]|nr:SRPBCC family protein [Acidimicrobiaceae bacterium]
MKIVSVSRFVPAPANEIFDLLADPKKHAVIDGSGSVKSALESAPQRLALGATFGMSMKIVAPYRITNTVVEFVESKQIAWQHFGGHIWRYILEPTESGTTVTEQFSYATSRHPLGMKLFGYVSRNERSIHKTLANLAAYFGAKN